MEYQAVFKCRLCGESYVGACTGNKNIALQSLTSACLGLPLQPQAPTMTETHACANGDLGVADFQGFRKVET